MPHIRFISAVLAALMLLAPAKPAPAQEPGGEPAFVSGGLGWFDVNDDEDTLDLRFEYRDHRRIFFLKPWAGIEGTGEGGLWGGGGVLLDVFFGRRFVLTGSFGVGLYEEGDGKDLGSAIEFRSQIEAGFRFDDRSRLAVAFSHISNAGITDTNPGAEIVTLYYHLPLRNLFPE